MNEGMLHARRGIYHNTNDKEVLGCEAHLHIYARELIAHREGTEPATMPKSFIKYAMNVVVVIMTDQRNKQIPENKKTKKRHSRKFNNNNGKQAVFLAPEFRTVTTPKIKNQERERKNRMI